MISSMPASFELKFEPNLPLVSVVRRFVSEFFARTMGDAELVSRIAVTAHELLENAAKYSCDGQTRIRIDIFEGGVAEVRVWNRSTPEQAAELSQHFHKVSTAPDALAYYLDAMRQTARRREGSGLGLARIRAETGMALGLTVQEGQIEMQARTLPQGVA